MKAVAQASHKRSLADFQQALKEYRKELEEDVIVKAHLGTLYDTMLEQNLCRIIEPYSRVQVSFNLIVFLVRRNYFLFSFQFRFHTSPNQLNCQWFKWKKNCHK